MKQIAIEKCASACLLAKSCGAGGYICRADAHGRRVGVLHPRPDPPDWCPARWGVLVEFQGADEEQGQ